MGPKAALILLTLISPVLMVILMFGGAGLVGLGIPMICGLPVLLVIVGTRGRRPSLPALLSVWLILSGSWLGVGWLSSSSDLTHPSIDAAITVMGLMLVGLGLLPLLVVGWLYARTFDDNGLSVEDLGPTGKEERER